MAGFLYPNEAVVEWGLLIVIYPYITGLVAGAFIVSSLYHVFGINSLKPVARFSLLTSLAFLLVAPMPLVIHLGHPERALEMFMRPNFVSAMSGFGYIWMFYLLILLLEIWLVFRPDIIRYARSAEEGVKKNFYSILALGVYDLSEKSLATDKKLIRLLALVGIPVACLLHGYVGFIFGALKANPWWSTPLMPVIFLLSAIVSGIALLLVLYIVVTKIRKAALDHGCLRAMALWLGGFLTLALTMEGLELLSMFYESEESWDAIRQLITQQLAVSYIGVQFLFGSVLSLLVLGFAEISRMTPQAKTRLRLLASVFVLIGVLAMRWNVVLGGQMISKSLRGLGSYVPPLTGVDGIIVAAAVLALPFIILTVITRLLSPWQPEVKPVEHRRLSF